MKLKKKWPITQLNLFHFDPSKEYFFCVIIRQKPFPFWCVCGVTQFYHKFIILGSVCASKRENKFQLVDAIEQTPQIHIHIHVYIHIHIHSTICDKI